jgi:trans-aconitate methyltransferase
MDDLHSFLFGIFLTYKFKNVIDLGCAHGDTVAELNHICPAAGLDISSGYIKEARRLHPKVKFIVADLRTWKPKKKYDVALTMGTLIHIPRNEIKKTINHILWNIADRAIFSESSACTAYEPGRTVKYDAKKYWEYRAKYNAGKKVKHGLEDLQMEYYFNHDYPKLFDQLGLRYQIVATFDKFTKTRLYYVWREI